MNYAVELVFDDESQNIINEFRKLLDNNGVHDEAVKLNHISIGDYFTSDIEGLKAKVLEFSKQIKPFEITLCSVGSFMTEENVIFLEPVMTEELKSIHKKFIDLMADFDGELNEYYEIDKWMPHCTIAIRLSDEELFKGFRLLKENIKLPMNVKINKIDLIQYPLNQILIAALK
ncbi:MAG: 2'-5' RNA ligase family protein [Lachnospiraceae bacterium]|nr:2'-5' RNA ligase family protein [Lachnospiraceae bacterium]